MSKILIFLTDEMKQIRFKNGKLKIKKNFFVLKSKKIEQFIVFEGVKFLIFLSLKYDQ